MYLSTCLVDTRAYPNPIHLGMLFIPPHWHLNIRYENLPCRRTTTRQGIEVVGTNYLHICIGDLCTSIRFCIDNSLAVSALLDKTYIDKLIKDIFPMERWVVSIQSRTMAILNSKPNPPPVVTSVRNDMERTTTESVTAQLKDQKHVQVDYIVRMLKAKTLPPLSVTPLRMKDAMGVLVAVEIMCSFGESR